MKKGYYSIVACIAVWLMVLVACTGCHYPQIDLTRADSLPERTRDSLACLYEHNYSWGLNLTVNTDSVRLACLPVKDLFVTLHRGDGVVVAEFDVHPADSIDSVWVRLAHRQEVQGWVRECELKEWFVPTDTVSQAIHLFSHTHAKYFIAILTLFVAAWLVSVYRKRRLRLVYFDDIDSIYPLLLCLLMAFCATAYESMQVWAPDTWERFYFNPTLSPFRVPLLPALFLGGLWFFLIVFLAVLDDLFRQLSPSMALFYLLGLASCCIFCYFFFIVTTHFYIGYLFLAAFVRLFAIRLRITLNAPRYRCGRCGGKMKHKGMCPHCGAKNV